MSAASPPVVPADPHAPASRGVASRAWLLLVLAGLVGGGAAWWLLDRYDHPFAQTGELEQLSAKRRALVPLTPQENTRIAELEGALERKNTCVTFAAMGLPLAAFVGLAAGLLGRSAAASVIGLVGGAVAGVLLGAGAGWLSALVYQQMKIELALDPGYAAVGSHAVTWVLLGAAASLAAWAGVRRAGVSLARAAGAAAVGALVAAAVYPIVAGLAFTMNNSDLIIPAGRWNRLVWVELAAAAITFGIARAVSRATTSHAATPAAVGAERVTAA